MNKDRFFHFLNIILFPGVIIHEIAHAIMVLLIPNSKLLDISLSIEDQSFVEYEMPTTATQCLIISIAPIYVNTLLSILIIDYLSDISIVDFKTLILFIILYYISVVSISTSIPSSKDAYSPIKHMREEWSVRRIPLIIPFAPIITILTIPIYIISKIIEESSIVYYILPVIASISIMYIIMYRPNLVELDNIPKLISIIWDYIQTNV